MSLQPNAAWTLAQETRALLTRLDRVKPLVLTMPMVPAAAPSTEAMDAIDSFLTEGRQKLRGRVLAYLRWLETPRAEGATAAEAQRRFSFLKLRFNAVLTQLDIFADALTQRGEHETGVWLSGLDAVAADALRLRGSLYPVPPVVTYVDRGHGAAIRRARTRLPGGGRSPVAVIRVPRERMVGSGIASSLVHEAGHQGAALLGLLPELRLALRERAGVETGPRRGAWLLWERWISEIVADFWASAHLGVAATQGLIGVLSVPRAFVFRIALDDPHPFPWIRVKLSVAFGQALFPHAQWQELDRLWESFYPLAGLPRYTRAVIGGLEATFLEFVELLVNHRARTLGGRRLVAVFPVAARQPLRLRALWSHWRRTPRAAFASSPTLLFAVLGQARQDRRLGAEQESQMVAKALERWALGRPRERAVAEPFRRMGRAA